MLALAAYIGGRRFASRGKTVTARWKIQKELGRKVQNGSHPMNPTLIGVIVFACTLGGVLLGMWLRTILPEHHLNNESRDTVKLGAGLIATMTALVLGLVTASAKSSFDNMNTTVKSTAVDILTLDRVLARYGPETSEIRGIFHDLIANRIDMIWPEGSSHSTPSDPLRMAVTAEGISDRLHHLTPREDSQRALQSLALTLVESLLRSRWLLYAIGGSSIPLPFLIILLFWLTITFASFGLFAPQNATVIAVLFVCAMSVGGAVFLIAEMDGPFDGVLKVSADPLRYALSHLNQ